MYPARMNALRSKDGRVFRLAQDAEEHAMCAALASERARTPRYGFRGVRLPDDAERPSYHAALDDKGCLLATLRAFTLARNAHENIRARLCAVPEGRIADVGVYYRHDETNETPQWPLLAGLFASLHAGGVRFAYACGHGAVVRALTKIGFERLSATPFRAPDWDYEWHPLLLDIDARAADDDSAFWRRCREVKESAAG